MAETDWKEMFFEQQGRFAEAIGCISHPNDILGAIRDLKERAAGNDRDRAARKERLVNVMIDALKAEGCTDLEIDTAHTSLVRIASELVRP